MGCAGRRHQFPANYNIGEVEVVDGVIYHKTEYRERRNHFAYLPAPSQHPASRPRAMRFWALPRWDNPAAVAAGQLTNSIAHGWAPIGAHQVKLDLAAGETRQIVFVLGYQETRSTGNSIRPERRSSIRS